MSSRMKIYGDSRSGNCYKLQLLCAELAIEYEWQEIDILAGDTHTPQFLEMNPHGKIPLLALPDGEHLAESNAILAFLAEGAPLAGSNRLQRARVLQWMFFEQNSHEPNIATSRFIIQYLGNPAERQSALRDKAAAGYLALEVMEQHLSGSNYFVGGDFTIADIALFAYTHVADEGGFDLENFSSIRIWMDRIKARPAFVAMKGS